MDRGFRDGMLSNSRNIQTEALSLARGQVAECLLALPPDQSWSVSRAELERIFSNVNSVAHAATKLANIEQEPGEHM